LEKTLINQRLKIGFRALTWFPPVSSGGGGLRLLLLLGGTLLVASHPCGHKMLHLHALGGCSALKEEEELGDYFSTKNDLDLTLEAAAPLRKRKTKRQSGKWRG
jgi:hypothetical protein